MRTTKKLYRNGVAHPAVYSDALLPVFERVILEHVAGAMGDVFYGANNRPLILDPFAGTGRVHELPFATVGVELEPEWAELHPSTIVANALSLPFANESFDAIVTSPCLTHGQRILRRDLRWVPVEEIEVGDEVIAFDESPPFIKTNGQPARRKWRIATVTESYPTFAECARVHLSNGDIVTCTENHPWLAQRFASGGNQRQIKGGYTQWVETRDLKRTTGWWVHKQLEPWDTATSYEAGWLAGMLDGEGSLSFGVHGSPKLVVCQNEGLLSDLVQQRFKALGYEISMIPRKESDVVNVYVSGGFPAVLRALGELRPSRLLEKLDVLNVASRSLQATEKVQVEAVIPIGRRSIQGITTTTGTYIGEGYLHHNTYGNRMADHHNAKDASLRRSYKHDIGRDLHPDNSGQMHWGEQYRAFHASAWLEVARTLKRGGIFVLNCKNHIRGGEEQRVTEWHIAALEELGMEMLEQIPVGTPGMRYGANRQRLQEWVVAMQKPLTVPLIGGLPKVGEDFVQQRLDVH